MKDQTISLRVTEEWWERVKAAAEAESKKLGVPVSATAYIERAVTKQMGKK